MNYKKNYRELENYVEQVEILCKPGLNTGLTVLDVHLPNVEQLRN